MSEEISARSSRESKKRLDIAGPPQTWFQALVACELCLEVPYFFLSLRMLLSSSSQLPRWFRWISIVYGARAATTLVPILAATLSNKENPVSEKMILFGFYLPYLLVPLCWVYTRIQYKDACDEDAARKQKGA